MNNKELKLNINIKEPDFFKDSEIVTIKGKKGEKGDKGDTGEKGDKGEQGIQGIQGIKGDKGDKGDVGPAGKKGKDGRDGIDGKDGKDGKNGKNGKDGSPDTPEQVKEKLMIVGLSFNELKDTPDFERFFASKTSSKDIDWGEIKGDILNQTDLISYISSHSGGDLQVTTSLGATTTIESTFSGGLIAGGIKNDLGLASTPSYSFTGDTNTGMFSTGADTIGFATNGVNRVTIGSSGNVGIGTGSPSKKLHIYGTDNAIRLTYPSAADWDMNVNSSGTFGLFPNNGSSALSVTSSGNVGIGTTNPTSSFGKTLEVNANGTGSAGLTLNTGTQKYTFGATGTGNLGFYDETHSAYRLSITSAGNVGIGTTSPTTRLNVIGDSSTIDSGFIVSSHTLTNNTNKYGGFTVPHYNNSVRADIMGFWVSSQSSITELLIGGGFGGKLSPTSIFFYTATNNTSSGSVRGRFDASGRFAIGTHTPSYFFDLINTSTNQHRIGYNASNYLDTRVFSSGAVYYNAIGSVPYHEFRLNNSSKLQINDSVSYFSSNTNLAIFGTGADVGFYLGAGYYSSMEIGLYGQDSDEAIAVYDQDLYEFYYFNRGLYGNDTAIYTNALFHPVQAPTASAPAYQEGAIYYDTTLHKLRIGGASGWETITSI